VSAHLRHEGLPRDRVLAGMVRILDTGMIRVGCDEYAHDHHHYGLSTLRRHHVSLRGGGVIHFNFVGKCGESHHINVHDRVVARLIGDLFTLPGARVFRYHAEDGRLLNATAGTVNDYFKRMVGRAFSVKEFRTWMGTVVCAAALGHLGPARTKRAQDAAIKSAVQITADTLGNTPAICKSSYVMPRVLDLYRRGVV